MATTETHSLAGAPTPEEDAFELGYMLAQFRWNLLEAVYSDSSGAADELKSFVEHMQPLMMAILPELGGGEPYRIAKDFGDTIHDFQSFEHAEDFKRCFDLRGMVSPPEIVDAIYPLSRYLPSTADTLLKSTIDEVQGTPLLARCVQLGVLVAEGIYPPVSGRVFFEIRQSQQWLDLREREKARGASPSKPGSGNSPTELAHDCKPLEFELHRRGISPGDLLPNDIWPDEVRRLLAAVNLRDLHAVGLDVFNCSPPRRVEKISQLTSTIHQHLRSRSFIEGNHAEIAIVETLIDCRYSEVAVRPTLDQPDLDSQVFGAPFVLPVLDQEDESDAGTALAPQNLFQVG